MNPVSQKIIESQKNGYSVILTSAATAETLQGINLSTNHHEFEKSEQYCIIRKLI